MSHSVAKNLTVINEKIMESCKKVNRDPSEVKIVAVTKYVSIERAIEAKLAGLIHFGENYEAGLLSKFEELHEHVHWHFIGTLQSKKVKKIIDKVDYIHSLDRISLANEINKRAKKEVKCFIQVNVSNEESKHGLHPDELVPFIESLSEYPLIKVVGLMTMAPNTDDHDVIRSCFRYLKDLQKNVQALSLPYATCHELSMGMSGDFEIAIEEGATFIRIGTSLVGKEV